MQHIKQVKITILVNKKYDRNDCVQKTYLFGHHQTLRLVMFLAFRLLNSELNTSPNEC